MQTDALVALRRRHRGPVIGPDDAGYDPARLTFNGMVDRRPHLIARPLDVDDVEAAISYAVEADLPIAVRGGGHSVAGHCMGEGSVVVDLRLQRSVAVHPDGRTATCGGGALWEDLDPPCLRHGLATPGGTFGDTGVAGLTLGGGIGHLIGLHGLTLDNLLATTVVTADGEVVRANRNENADLFWALRGGGGNFGVVTRFSFHLHQVGPTITGGLIVWSADRAAEVLAAYRELTEQAPRELTAAAIVRLAPPAPFLPQQWHGKPIAGMILCHSGPDAEADLAAVRALGDPIVDLVTPKPYVAMQSLLNAMEPKWLHRYWKAEFLPGLSSEFLDAFRSSALRVTSPLSQSIIFHVAGALNEHADDDGAVGNRDAHYIGGGPPPRPPPPPPPPQAAPGRDRGG